MQFKNTMPTEVRSHAASNETDITGCIGFRVGTAGDVAVKTVNGASATGAVTIPGVLAGEIIPGNFTRIMATNTTASGITVFF